MAQQVGQRLRHARLEARLSQAALGAMVGVTSMQIAGYERGTTSLPIPRAVLLACALGMKPQALLPSADEVPLPTRKRVEEYPELIALYRQLTDRGRDKVRFLAQRLIFRGDIR